MKSLKESPPASRRAGRPPRRSLSPFIRQEAEPDPIATAELKALEETLQLPGIFEKLQNAPSNDAPELEKLCHNISRFQMQLQEKGFSEKLHAAMLRLFDVKTELFLIDHHDRASCEKMGWPDEVRDVVLFSKERDALVGRYFAPVFENQPGIFSAFINKWVESTNPDRILHFLDFCRSSRNPTFEYYLLFTHPVLNRIVSNKTFMRELFQKTTPVVKKLSSPSWERDVRAALGV